MMPRENKKKLYKKQTAFFYSLHNENEWNKISLTSCTLCDTIGNEKGSDKMAWFNTLKTLREKSGESMSETAEILNIAKSTYASYEYGKREPNIEMLTKIANHYNVSVDYILGRPEAKSPEDPLQVLVQQKNLDALEQVLFERYMQLPENARKEFVKFMQQVSEDAAKRNAAKEQKEDSGYITVSTTLGELEDRMKEDANSKDGA